MPRVQEQIVLPRPGAQITTQRLQHHSLQMRCWQAPAGGVSALSDQAAGDVITKAAVVAVGVAGGGADDRQFRRTALPSVEPKVRRSFAARWTGRVQVLTAGHGGGEGLREITGVRQFTSNFIPFASKSPIGQKKATPVMKGYQIKVPIHITDGGPRSKPAF